MKKIMVVFGTKPEAIKMRPLIKELKFRILLQTVVCVSGQHRQMLDMVLDCFGVTPDYGLSVMKIEYKKMRQASNPYWGRLCLRQNRGYPGGSLI